MPFLSGFKATQNFNACMNTRNTELIRLFNTTEVVIPSVGTLTNLTMYDTDAKTWHNVTKEMPTLPVCDLKAEIERVRNVDLNKLFRCST